MKKTTFIAALRPAPGLLPWPRSPTRAGHERHDRRAPSPTTSGAALPGATVTARNVDTGFTPHGPDERVRRLPSRVPADRQLHRRGHALRVQDLHAQRHRPATSTTRPGWTPPCRSAACAETVNVEARRARRSTPSTSEVSKTIDAAAIQSLPLVDRNVYTLLDLTPGVQSNNNGVASASSGTSTLVLGFPEQRTLINGGADGGTGSVNYYLDGGINMTGLRNTGNILPNPDAIQEFKVQTNSYNAEYGRFSSGIINVVTKSGTNRYQGLGVRVRARREDEREGVGLGAGDAAAQAQSVRRHDRRSDRGEQDVLLRAPTRDCARPPTRSSTAPSSRPPQERTGDFSASRTMPIDPATGQTFVCNGVVGRDLPEPSRSGGDEDHQQLHPRSQSSPGNIWQGYVPSPYDTDEVTDQGRPPDECGASFQRQLLPDERLEHGEGRDGQSALGQPGVQVAAAQRQRQRHVGHQLEPDQPGVVLVQPQLRRPSQPAGGVADRSGVDGDHPGCAVAAADHRQRLLHADQRDRRTEGRRRLLLGARRLQLDPRRARAQAGRRAVVQQDRPGHAAEQLRRSHLQQHRDHGQRARRLHDRHSERDDAGRAGHRAVEQLVRRRRSCRTTTASTRG